MVTLAACDRHISKLLPQEVGSTPKTWCPLRKACVLLLMWKCLSFISSLSSSEPFKGNRFPVSSQPWGSWLESSTFYLCKMARWLSKISKLKPLWSRWCARLSKIKNPFLDDYLNIPHPSMCQIGLSRLWRDPDGVTNTWFSPALINLKELCVKGPACVSDCRGNECLQGLQMLRLACGHVCRSITCLIVWM